jgi:hypothetical protein
VGLKHSPGEWVVGYGTGITGPRSAATVWLDGGEVEHKIVVSAPFMYNCNKAICFITGSDGHEDADARLIAAAPDLLAALQEVRRKLRVPPTQEGEATYQMIVAAIAKAEGR